MTNETNENKTEEFNFKVKIEIPENDDGIILNLTIEESLKDILKSFAVMTELKEDAIIGEEFKRFLIKGFISSKISHTSKLLFSEQLLKNSSITFKFYQIDVVAIQRILTDLKTDISFILDAYFNLCTEKKIKIIVEK